MTGLIAARELRQLLRSPATWIIAAILQAFLAWYFLSSLEQFIAIQAELATRDNAPGVTGYLSFRYLAPASAVLMLVCPLLTMRSLAGEYQQRTFVLLQSAPVASFSIILGKFLGILCFVLLLVALSLVMPLSLLWMTTVDLGTLASAALGLMAVASLCTATGVFFSSLTSNTMIAAIASILALLLLWIIGNGSFGQSATDAWLHELSSSSHLGSFYQGLIDAGDIGYFLVLTCLFLGLAILRLDSFRQSRLPA